VEIEKMSKRALKSAGRLAVALALVVSLSLASLGCAEKSCKTTQCQEAKCPTTNKACDPKCAAKCTKTAPAKTSEK
jgi:hypothetical protein